MGFLKAIAFPSRRVSLPLALATFVAALACVFGYFLARLGYFRDPIVNVMTLSKQLVVYKQHSGPYYTIGKSISEVESWAKSNGVTCEKTFGEYLDDPDKVEEARLRSHGGCLLLAEQDLRGVAFPADFIRGEIPAGHFLKIQFSGSPAIGPWKIYPFARSYFQNKAWPFPERSYEIYHVLNATEMNTTYLFKAPPAEAKP